MKSQLFENLTPHQKIKHDELIDYINNKHKFLLLQGSAGTGKTYLLSVLIDTLILLKHNIIVSTPTHKALSVISNKIVKKYHFSRLKFSTIHSELKLTMKVNEFTGERELVQQNTKNIPFSGYSVLIIDESSMLNQQIVDLITNYDIITIFVGDEKQLPPVKESVSPIFNYPTQLKLDLKIIELTEIIRQKNGNPIIDIALQPLSIKNPINKLSEDRMQGITYTKDLDKVITKLAESNGSSKLKYIAWTNQDVDFINNLVREKLYSDSNLEKIYNDEVLILRKPYLNIFKTNDEVIVSDVELKDIILTNPFDKSQVKFFAYSFNIRNNKLMEKAYIIHDKDKSKWQYFKGKLKKLAQEKKITWKQFYEINDSVISYKYNHALTVHVSQGSTFESCIINVKNCFYNSNISELTKLLYTALTRASNKVILFYQDYSIIKDASPNYSYEILDFE